MKIRHLNFLFSILIAFTGISSGCSLTESGVPVCAYFTRADAVFSGKILKIEDVPKTEDYPVGGHKIRFQVLQNFKGADNPTFTLITADWKTACGLNAKTGQTWIIYARNDIVVKAFQDFRGVRVEPKETSAELEALKNIVAGKSETAISGRFASNGEKDKYTDEAVEIAVEGKNFRQTTKTDADGAFDLPVPSEGKYKVELKFPYNASLVWDEGLLGTSLVQGNPTIFKYNVSLNDGDCVYSFFEVLRK